MDRWGSDLSDHLGADCVLARPRRTAQGHSFIGYFIFSLICFPIALITAYLVRDRRAMAF